MKDRRVTKKVPEEEKLELFKKQLAVDADMTLDEQRKANEDMRFVHVDGGMWEGHLESAYGERAKFEFDLASQYLSRFIGEWNENRVAVEFKPKDHKTSDDDSELMNGIHRADFGEYFGETAVDNAVDEASCCGFGAYMLTTCYEDESDDENDLQRIAWEDIHSAYNTVIWDGSAKKIDKRDARHCTLLEPFTEESFLEEWENSDPISAFEPESLRHLDSNLHSVDTIYVAQRYDVIKKYEDLFIYNDLENGDQIRVYEDKHEKIKDELKENEFMKFVRKRRILRQSVEKTVFSGEKILEPSRRIAGKWIPIIPMYGHRVFFDGSERYRGLIRKIKDPLRLFNMQVSQLGENSAGNGQEIPIFAPEQMNNQEIKEQWADKNNKPYLLAKPIYDADGNIVHMGPLGYQKPAGIDQTTAALMQIVLQFLNEQTGGAPQDTINPDISGKAINALAKRENMNTQNINDNIKNAIRWSGDVYLEMARDVYDSERMLNIIGRDGSEKSVQLFETVLDEETGNLVNINRLDGKRFKTMADTGPAYETLREQTVEDLKGTLQALKDLGKGEQYADAIIAIILENISGVGLGPLKDLNRKLMLASGLVKPETDEEKAMVAEMQQPKEDPQADLARAAAKQQEAEAASLTASAEQKTQDAAKKAAETEQIKVETEVIKHEAHIAGVDGLVAMRERIFTAPNQIN
ncbi:MAG: portal protein [Sneathiella sp.]